MGGASSTSDTTVGGMVKGGKVMGDVVVSDSRLRRRPHPPIASQSGMEWLAREGGFVNVSAADANAAVLRGQSVVIGATVNVARP